MHSTTSQMSTRDRIGAILRVTSGNFLEQFDFFLFGFMPPTSPIPFSGEQ